MKKMYFSHKWIALEDLYKCNRPTKTDTTYPLSFEDLSSKFEHGSRLYSMD